MVLDLGDLSFRVFDLLFRDLVDSALVAREFLVERVQLNLELEFLSLELVNLFRLRLARDPNRRRRFVEAIDRAVGLKKRERGASVFPAFVCMCA